MKRELVFRRAARSEYDAAGNWYEERRAGLGGDFTAAVQNVLDRIAVQPDFYADVWSGVREAIVKGFPYCVYFFDEPGRVVILSVFHSARDPDNWHSRIELFIFALLKKTLARSSASAQSTARTAKIYIRP